MSELTQRKRKIFLTLGIALAFIHLVLVPTGSRGAVLIPTQLEVSIGAEVARQIESKYKLLNNPELTAYVNDVGQKLVKVCGRRDVEYHFKILDEEMVNAFACPGGFIYVTTGILKLMDNEAELAVVLGHEIGHIAARHGAKKLQAQIGYSLLLSFLFKDQDVRNIANVAFNLIFLGYGRQDEFEADNLG
ncbi:M48 family metalloprotease, partial [Candidatus Aerophobetes bacterium]|nr:M48 family metalloprotease [Candidatus Aerophobetes bacterium]